MLWHIFYNYIYPAILVGLFASMILGIILIIGIMIFQLHWVFIFMYILFLIVVGLFCFIKFMTEVI